MKQLMFAFVCVFALVSALSFTAQAISLEYYGIEDSINADMSVHNTIVLKFKEPVNHLDYQLGFSIYNLSYESTFPFADCESGKNGQGSLITCDFVGMSLEENKLTLDFDTNDAINEKDGVYGFSVNYGVSLPIDRSFTVIRLPENSILSESVANQSFFPQGGNIASDGRHIMVYWEKENLTSGEDLRFSVLYSMPGLRDPIFNYLIITLTLVVVAAMIGIAIYMKKGTSTTKPEDVIESVLNKNEKKVVSVLNAHNGNAIQKNIVKETDFSKAKVSRLVKNLKERGVVEIEPVSGRENRIILKKMNNHKKENTDNDKHEKEKPE